MTARRGIRLSQAQKRDWLRLSRTEGVGPRAFKSLINRYGGAAAALEALPGLARARGRAIAMPSLDAIEAELTAVAAFGGRIIASGEEDYPESLLSIDGPPPVLLVKGRVDLLHRPAVAIVGARNASASGRKMAGLLARDLGQAGHVVVSGLARGIDAEAHRVSLETGTIAVLAGGLDRPYPPDNAALADQIAAEGLLVSEMPLGLSPRGRDFPRRNRLVAGLSQAVVVVEAARRSGSLITARLAGEQGREVLAVPGSPLDPRCEGTNDLLRDGAGLCCGAEDVLHVLRPMAGAVQRPLPLFREEAAEAGIFDEEEHVNDGEAVHEPPARRVLALLSLDPVDVDTLARMAGLSAGTTQAALMELELDGMIRREPGSRVARAP